MAEPDRFSVFDPQVGGYVTVPASELEHAKSYYGVENIETPEQTAARQEREQYDTLGETARAGAEGLIRGGSIGTSDYLANTLGLDTEGMARRRRLNPIIAGAGEVAGAIAPALLSGGETLAARGALESGALGLGRAATAPSGLALRAGAGAESLAGAGLRGLGLTGESALGRGLLRGGELAAGGAVEGGMFGAGQALSEASLAPDGNYDGLGEKLMSGATEGGMFGALGGLAIGGALGLGSRALEAGGSRLRKAITPTEEFANERAVKAIGGNGVDIRKIRTEENVQRIGADIRGTKLRDGTPLIEAGDTAEQIAAKSKIARQEVGQDLGAMRDSVASVGDAADAAGFIKAADKGVIAPLLNSPSPTIRAQGRRAAKELEALRIRSDAFGASQDAAGGIAKRIDSELVEKLATSKSGGIRRKAEELRGQLSAFQEMAAAGKVTREAAQDLTDGVLLPLMRSPSAPIRRSAKLMIRDVEAMGRAIPEPVTYADLLQQHEALKAVVYPKPVKGQGIPAAPPAHAEALQRVERILESTMEAHVEKTLQRVAPEQAGTYRALRQKNASLIKADEIGQRATLQGLGNRLASPSDMGVGLAMAAGEIASGGAFGVAKGLASGFIHNQIRTRGNSFLVHLANTQAQTDARITQAVKKFLGGAAAVRRVGVGEIAESSVSKAFEQRKGETKLKAFERVSAQIEKATVPQRMVSDVEAPNVAAASRAVAQRGIDFLKTKLPGGGQIKNPLYRPIEPHPSEIDRFARYYQAVNKPMTVFDSVERGDVTAEEAEALRVVRPQMFAQLQQEVSSQLVTHGKDVPHSKRIALGAILGVPTDRSLEPASIKSAQEAFASQSQAGQPPKNTPPAKPIAKTAQSESERLESQEFAI